MIVTKNLFHKSPLGMRFLIRIISSARIIFLPTVVTAVSSLFFLFVFWQCTSLSSVYLLALRLEVITVLPLFFLYTLSFFQTGVCRFSWASQIKLFLSDRSSWLLFGSFSVCCFLQTNLFCWYWSLKYLQSAAKLLEHLR